jgi:hypothetical protein
MNTLPFFTTNEMELVGAVGVDSGQLMIVDPCYVTDGPMYEDICNLTLAENYGEVALGFATTTLHGDGMYEVYAIKGANGRIAGMLVWMDDHEPDEDEEYEDEEEDPEDEEV